MIAKIKRNFDGNKWNVIWNPWIAILATDIGVKFDYKLNCITRRGKITPNMISEKDLISMFGGCK
jgi:hypothetical protein